MANGRHIEIQFPLAGLNRKRAYRQQAPYTTPDALNVRPVDSIEGRERGGSRPGLIESHTTDLGTPVRLLSQMTVALSDGVVAWSDTFSGLSLAAAWTQASWASNVPSILPSALASVDTSVDEGEVVADVLPVNTGEAYSVEMFLTPWNGEYHGKYRLYLRLNNTTPDIETDGVMVELDMTGSDGSYSCQFRSVLAGVVTNAAPVTGTLTTARPGWLSAMVSGTTVTVSWCGTVLGAFTAGAHTGYRTGFGMECTEEGGLCLANVFRVQYKSTESTDMIRSMLIASAGGDLYREEFHGSLESIMTTKTLRDDMLLTAAQSGQKLYIADYGGNVVEGDDGSVAGTSLTAAGIADWTALGLNIEDYWVVISNPLGTAVAQTYRISVIAAGSLTLRSAAGAGACSYRIERAPKVYDPAANTLDFQLPTAGQVPTGCPLVCRYLDRLVMAGAEIAPHVWYMSRQGDPADWDYGKTDAQRAVAGTASAAGVPGEPITALAPFSDDYLIIGCRNSIWRLRGDPAYGGSLDALSHKVGIIGANAWCLGPNGELVFLSLDGLYALAPGGDSFPTPISREVLPQEFLNINPALVSARLEYDVQGRGIHVFLTSEPSNQRIHWWLDWTQKTFWPVSLQTDHEPTATCAIQSTAIEDSCVILGGRDGTLRAFSNLAETDCGTVFSSYAVIGPIGLAADAQVGKLDTIDAVVAEDSGDVTWELRPSLTFEGTLGASVSDTGTWVAGINATARVACRGQACTVKLIGESGRAWAIEQIVGVVRPGGPRRLP